MSECHNRMSVLCSRFVSHATYPECCIEVDQFITEVITSYHELQRNDSLPSGVSYQENGFFLLCMRNGGRGLYMCMINMLSTRLLHCHYFEEHVVI